MEFAESREGESVTETLEILGDSELLESLETSITELEQGKTISWEAVKRSLGIDSSQEN